MVLTENFDLSEFESKDGSSMPSDVRQNIIRLANALQVIRDYFNSPIMVTSGYRSPEHNATISGAATNSQHIHGKAADIIVSGRTAVEMYEGIEYLISQNRIPEGGLGLYSNRVHYDIRGYKSRWNEPEGNDDTIVDKTIGAIEGTLIMLVLGKIANLF